MLLAVFVGASFSYLAEQQPTRCHHWSHLQANEAYTGTLKYPLCILHTHPPSKFSLQDLSGRLYLRTMTKTNFFKTRNIKIFLAGFLLALVATIIIVLEINFPYTGWLWWAGFFIALVGMIRVIRDVTGISKKRD